TFQISKLITCAWRWRKSLAGGVSLTLRSAAQVTSLRYTSPETLAEQVRHFDEEGATDATGARFHRAGESAEAGARQASALHDVRGDGGSRGRHRQKRAMV